MRGKMRMSGVCYDPEAVEAVDEKAVLGGGDYWQSEDKG